jgi:hypothetical protein
MQSSNLELFLTELQLLGSAVSHLPWIFFLRRCVMQLRVSVWPPAIAFILGRCCILVMPEVAGTVLFDTHDSALRECQSVTGLSTL